MSADTRSIRVIRPGLMTTVQDEGRRGYQRFGVPVSGPMDWYSHRAANRIVGNAETAATLEATVMGPELECDADVVIGLAGATFRLEIDGQAVPAGVAHRVHAGARLRFGRPAVGARAYLAVDGGFTVPPVLDSRSTHVTARLGGLDGRPLRAGDCLPLGECRAAQPAGSRRTQPVPVLELPRGGARLRVLPGLQASAGRAAFEALLGSRFSISNLSNRMAYRLEGPALRLDMPGLISDVVGPGWVQVPPSGQPMLLMADCQTTGGYPVVATVITADLPIAGQLGPGDWVEFDACDRDGAIEALRARVARLG